MLAGQGPDLERLSGELSRRPWFEVRGRYVPDTEMAQLVLDADVLALPYVEASQSGVVALAIGSALPVVATDVGQLGPLTRATGVGTVVQPDPAEIAEAIVGLLSDTGRRATCRANAPQRRPRNAGPEGIARDTLAVYRAAGASAVDQAELSNGGSMRRTELV